MNGRSLQAQEWISVQTENIQGMLLQPPGADDTCGHIGVLQAA